MFGGVHELTFDGLTVNVDFTKLRLAIANRSEFRGEIYRGENIDGVYTVSVFGEPMAWFRDEFVEVNFSRDSEAKAKMLELVWEMR